ncbi:hypothetical protein LAZ67_12002744 [Cordylochernes scorpioides]|uniref:Mos1 transposase HTH domain-containing protein n=1 Tax=Cordylochernes scorpioides TaxID=51811 RepID=A0ABY6L3W6_9ARAC|nr:hypothetical protein LAZ67_12002744 [Cordylochernes scorpioides]
MYNDISSVIHALIDPLKTQHFLIGTIYKPPQGRKCIVTSQSAEALVSEVIHSNGKDANVLTNIDNENNIVTINVGPTEENSKKLELDNNNVENVIENKENVDPNIDTEEKDTEMNADPHECPNSQSAEHVEFGEFMIAQEFPNVANVLNIQPFVMELPVVSPASCELLSVIRFLAAKKNSAKDIHTELCQVYGEGCMSSGMVRRWVREFKNGRTDVHDEPHAGRPSVSDETIAKVEAAMLEDRRITVRKLYGILEFDLTGDDTWVHYTTRETKEQFKQWKHTPSPKPLKFKQTLSAEKLMATVFWDRKGLLLCDFMRRGTIINSVRYCETLKQLRRASQNKRRGMLTKGVRFHHDNARPHTARQTTALIEEFGWELVSHPPYSPDVAPNDFHLFLELKKNLGGTQFQDDDELEEAVLGFYAARRQSYLTLGCISGCPECKNASNETGNM